MVYLQQVQAMMGPPQCWPVQHRHLILTWCGNTPKVCAEGESQNAAPLMLYREEQCLGVMNINGGWSDAKALLAIPEGRRGTPSLRAPLTSAQWSLFGDLRLVHRWPRTHRSCRSD